MGFLSVFFLLQLPEPSYNRLSLTGASVCSESTLNAGLLPPVSAMKTSLDPLRKREKGEFHNREDGLPLSHPLRVASHSASWEQLSL